MKMAKASEADLDAAMKLCSALEALERYRTMPTPDDDTEDAEPFDEDDREDCKKALAIVLELFGRASLFRVVFGMAVILDPRNKVVDPNADTLEIHADIRREQEDGARYRWLRDSTHSSEALRALLDGAPSVIGGINEFDAAIDAAMLKTPNVQIEGLDAALCGQSLSNAGLEG